MWARRLAALLRGATSLAVLALLGCASLDEDQARLCRIALPALEPPGSHVVVQRVGAIEQGVRIEYEMARDGGGALPRFAECRFGLARRLEMEAITTDRGEVPGATVYLLRRYYVETAEGVAADPGPGLAGASHWRLQGGGALFIASVIAIMLLFRGRFARARRR